MTPSAMLSKFVMDGAYFLGEIDTESLWNFLGLGVHQVVRPVTEINDVYDLDRNYEAYEELHSLVVTTLRRGYVCEHCGEQKHLHCQFCN
jgi:hypothetical protein